MFCAYWAKISGERLQDHWSSGLLINLCNYCSLLDPDQIALHGLHFLRLQRCFRDHLAPVS